MRFTEESIKALLERYSYCPTSGVITSMKTGKPLTCCNNNGYIMVQFRINYAQRKYLGHHVAWLMTYGVWPTEIDHINRDRADNRIVNLREVTRAENLRNRIDASSIQSQYDCVSWHKAHKKWQARLPYKIDRKRTQLGYFDCEHEAHAALQAAIKPQL